MLDVLGYDLNTASGQQDALEAMYEEHNRQYDQASTYQSLPIAAYGVASLSITPTDRTNSTPISVIYHGLGYEPIFMLFQGTMAAGGITGMPLLDAFYNTFLGDFQFVGHVRAYTDKSNIWVVWNDQLQTSTQSITYLIFASPLLPN